MLFRTLLALIFLAALAAFGYAFWLVLSPEGHNWRVDIPIERRLEKKPEKPSEPAPVEPPQAAAPATNPTPAPTITPGVQSERPITLSMPIVCNPGTDCWVVNYVDLDPGPGRKDYRCGEMSYDGHKGTDIGLANESRIQETIPVVASAAGKVLGVRDGEEDLGTAGMEAAKAAGKECGNGVRIDHGDGWATQYCHMRKGSVVVRAGQEVAAGEVLGAVGLSGMTQFPHVHLSLSHNGDVVDPFRGVEGGQACGLGAQPLWDEKTLRDLAALEAPSLLDVAFFDRVPDSDVAAAGDAALTAFAPSAEAVVLWFRAAGVEPGDTGRILISDPQGDEVVDTTVTFDRTQSAMFRAVGIRNSQDKFPDGLPQGEWTGRVELKRDGRVTGERTVRLTVSATN